MTESKVKGTGKLLAIMMTAACIAALASCVLAMSTEKADAAAKKTVYLPTKATTSMSFNGEKPSTGISTYKYDKRGLRKSMTVKSGKDTTKVTYKRNKKGALLSSKTYTNGRLTGMTKNTLNKKGFVRKSVDYRVTNGKLKKLTMLTYTYYGNGDPKEVKSKDLSETDYESTTTYAKGRKIKKMVTKSSLYNSTSTYNKKGLEVKNVFSYPNEYRGNEVYTYKYNKRGDIIKQTSVETQIYKDGKTEKINNTTKTTYKYDKHGNILKQTDNIKRTGDINSTSKFVSTNKYKKFKIDKKYLKYADSNAI